ncbi:uncharacterized protein LOC106874913 [Octopus bimaculoides]|uniref:uncharacterized protein LOC106874913 n=1 Tax=Octopus bimaculoides TaxID=37653 RepID=UPI00071DA0ED|nr:uncharacterized protein LOC106874913 [Octopus bimaculoides]|eukprot:XP_014778317.1 PREDICTED: uncharacterized protein LOC106874913 [Octopus bimaculoides]
MRQLLGENNLPDRILKQIFVKRLPANTQVILASAKESTTIEELAEMADRIAESTNPFATVAPVASSTNPFTDPPKSSEMLELRALIAQQSAQTQTLAAQLQELTVRDRSSRDHSPYRHFNRRRSRSPSATRRSGLCFYHAKFGKDAHSCRPPCSYKINIPHSSGNDQDRT